MHEPITPTVVAYHGLAALGGAVAHALNAHRTGKSKTFWDFVMLVLMSSFSGVMFGLIGLHVLDHQTYLSMALAGSGGWLGVEGMGMVLQWLKGRVSK